MGLRYTVVVMVRSNIELVQRNELDGQSCCIGVELTFELVLYS
jgi:hypothetical protein